MKKALITGITGQDGSYLAEFLIKKNYLVYGIIRRSSSFNTERIDHIFQDPHEKNKSLILVYGDLSDSSNLSKIINEIMPDEVYNLAAQSHVRISFDVPEDTASITGLGALRILEILRSIKEKTGKNIKYYQASSSEMFGMVQEQKQKETTPFYPRSPYGVAKVFAYWICVNYREGYDMFAVNGILFNHESPRRGLTFVTRKITTAVAKIKEGVLDTFYLGNLDAKRDWGHAREYVEAMWLMLQQEKPEDFVIATGEAHSVREFLEKSFKAANIPVKSNGKQGVEEEYVRTDTGKVVVKIDPKYFRPAEVDFLLGDASKAKEKLHWEPKIKFDTLVEEMVTEDIKLVRENLYGKRK
jgi:GDPmannose 4,6-dehydratase